MFVPGTVGNTLSLTDSSLIYTKKKISRGKNTKMYVDVTSASGSTDFIFTTTQHNFSNNMPIVDYITSRGVKSIDISNVDVPFYIEMYIYYSGSCNIANIWME